MKNSMRQSRCRDTDQRSDKFAFVNRNPQTMLKELLQEQNIPMSYRYELDIPDLNEYFGMKDKLQMESCIEECKRKVNTCRNRLEQLKLKINDQYTQELEDQEISICQQNNPTIQFIPKNNKRDLRYQQRKIHTTIAETYEKKSNQADMFNKTLYFVIRNRDLSLEEKSEKINKSIQGQAFLDNTQNDLKRSLHNTIRASRQQKQKFLGILKDLSRRKGSIDDVDRSKLMKMRNQIVQGQYVEM